MTFSDGRIWSVRRPPVTASSACSRTSSSRSSLHRLDSSCWFMKHLASTNCKRCTDAMPLSSQSASGLRCTPSAPSGASGPGWRHRSSRWGRGSRFSVPRARHNRLAVARRGRRRSTSPSWSGVAAERGLMGAARERFIPVSRGVGAVRRSARSNKEARPHQAIPHGRAQNRAVRTGSQPVSRASRRSRR